MFHRVLINLQKYAHSLCLVPIHTPVSVVYIKSLKVHPLYKVIKQITVLFYTSHAQQLINAPLETEDEIGKIKKRGSIPAKLTPHRLQDLP